MTTNERIERWYSKWEHPGLHHVEGNTDTILIASDYDIDITLWHGENGLLAEIERRGLAIDFFDAIEQIIKATVTTACSATMLIWRVLRATPAQLSAALLKVIEGSS